MPSFRVVVLRDDMSPFGGARLRFSLGLPPLNLEGETTTSQNGEASFDFPFPWPPIGLPPGIMVTVTTRDYQLVPRSDAARPFPVVGYYDLPLDTGLPAATTRTPIVPDSVVELVARQVFLITCPMCGRHFRTVKPLAVTGEPANRCPNDTHDFTMVEQAIAATPASFVTPVTGQDPKATPTAVTCRGSIPAVTSVGTMRLCWDESRFAISNGGDYTLWGDAPQRARRVRVIGRATWNAAAINTGRGRLWEFHSTAQGASPPYANLTIPSNETTPLASVLAWMTVHHTTDTPQGSFQTVLDLQEKHQTRGVGHDKSPAADIGYHFVIDDDGSVYEGRPLGIEGSHVKVFNGGNIGIVVAGNFERLGSDEPTGLALKSLERLVAVLSARFGVMSVWTHKARLNQSSPGQETECPGHRLIPYIDTLRQRFPGPPA